MDSPVDPRTIATVGPAQQEISAERVQYFMLYA
jgi:hypothetical protein